MTHMEKVLKMHEQLVDLDNEGIKLCGPTLWRIHLYDLKSLKTLAEEVNQPIVFNEQSSDEDYSCYYIGFDYQGIYFFMLCFKDEASDEELSYLPTKEQYNV